MMTGMNNVLDTHFIHSLPSRTWSTQAWLSTRLGARNASEASADRRMDSRGRSNSWLLVLDTDNFAGPVSFTWPQYWKFDNKRDPYGLVDFGMDSTLPSVIQVGFEWNHMQIFAGSKCQSN